MDSGIEHTLSKPEHDTKLYQQHDFMLPQLLVFLKGEKTPHNHVDYTPVHQSFGSGWTVLTQH